MSVTNISLVFTRAFRLITRGIHIYLAAAFILFTLNSSAGIINFLVVRIPICIVHCFS